MIFEAKNYIRNRAATEKILQHAGVYDPAWEHDNCGVGLVAATDGKPSRSVVEAAINALRAIWHRGAVDADGMTGETWGWESIGV